MLDNKTEKIEQSDVEMEKQLVTKTSHLRFVGKTYLPATKAGKGISQNNKRPFDSVDPDFKKWKAKTVSKDTEKAIAYTFKQTADGTHVDIFGSLKLDLDIISSATDEQTKAYFLNVSEILNPRGYTTHILFKNEKNERFVASVIRYLHGSVNIYLHRFSKEYVWYAQGGYYFVAILKR